MNKVKKILISSVYNHLCERDPDWKVDYMKRVKFKDLYFAWAEYEVRRGFHTRSFYYKSWEKGYLPNADFIRFNTYAMQ